MAENDTDFKKIKKLITIMKENNLVEVEIKHGDDKILLKQAQPVQPPQQTITAMPIVTAPNVTIPTATDDEVEAAVAGGASLGNLVEIKSPIVGTFYDKPSPDSEPYVEKDSKVSSQTVVCVVEAMKVMNEIKADMTGTIVDVMVASGQAVEYGQVLFRVRPE